MLKSDERQSNASVSRDAFNSRLRTTTTPRDAAADHRYLPTCNGCVAREAGACPGFGVKSEPDANAKRSPGAVSSQVQVFPPRRSILHQRDETEYVPVICSGWAASSITTTNGRKQIVSFALAGEVASMNFLFESCTGRAIEAVSQVSCRKFRRSDLRDAVLGNPALLGKIGRVFSAERERGDQLSLDLGRRSAEARLARMISALFERLQRKGLTDGDTIEFPLRQQQLADATGLTAVHVCKILSRFRATGLIRLDTRKLTILDHKGLRELVEWH